MWLGIAAGVLGGGVALLPLPVRWEAALGVALAVVLQGPLGWWVVVRHGTARFTAAWGLGILARFAAVGLVGLVIVPGLGWKPGPVLGAMVAALMVLLAVEAAAALGQQSQGFDR